MTSSSDRDPDRYPDRYLDRSPDRYLDQLAHLIAEHGVHAFEGDIARLVVRMRAAGLDSPLIGLLADHHAAPVARQRAFGHLVCLLVGNDDRIGAASPGSLCHAA